MKTDISEHKRKAFTVYIHNSMCFPCAISFFLEIQLYYTSSHWVCTVCEQKAHLIPTSSQISNIFHYVCNTECWVTLTHMTRQRMARGRSVDGSWKKKNEDEHCPSLRWQFMTESIVSTVYCDGNLHLQFFFVTSARNSKKGLVIKGVRWSSHWYCL